MLEVIAPEVESILDCFQPLEDPRSTINRKHLLGDLIVISVYGRHGSYLSRSCQRTWPNRYSDLLSLQGARRHSRLLELERTSYDRYRHSRKPPG